MVELSAHLDALAEECEDGTDPETCAESLASTVAACEDASSRASSDRNNGTWFAIGCLGGIVGWLIAQAIDSQPPASALVGKDEAYVATYTDCYRSESKRLRSRGALTGCLVGTVATTALYAVLIATAETD